MKKVYRFMNKTELHLLSSGCNIESRGKKFKSSTATGICFLEKYTVPIKCDDMTSAYSISKMYMMLKSYFKGEERFLVEFIVTDSIKFKKSVAKYYYCYGGFYGIPHEFQLKEIFLNSYNRDLLIPTRYAVIEMSRQYDQVWNYDLDSYECIEKTYPHFIWYNFN